MAEATGRKRALWCSHPGAHTCHSVSGSHQPEPPCPSLPQPTGSGAQSAAWAAGQVPPTSAIRSFAQGLRTSGFAPAFPCALPQHQVHCQIETQPTIMCLQARLGAGYNLGLGWGWVGLRVGKMSGVGGSGTLG